MYTVSTENLKDGLYALFNTDRGQILCELFYDKTPMTVANFVGLVEGKLKAAKERKFYDSLIFHRVIENFMIQGGDPEGTGRGGPGYRFPDEFVEELTFNEKGKLAMANAGPNTNGSQFFITHVPTEWLNNKHTIFGQVVDGQNVVDEIKQGDHMNEINILRIGADVENYEVTQEMFDNLVKESGKKEEERKQRILAKVIEGCTKTDKGIYYKVLEEGYGEKCGKGKNVTVEYRGYLTDGQLFDGSSGMEKEGHEPLDFVTDAGQMIPGFDIMVQDMQEGETRKIVLPPELAYGDSGYPGVIPPKSYICFDVELYKIH